ncbi:hypothetical protein D9757_004886 [Collybiopsis confluens]|uniref:Uncharacterized protein n=1 Tax=Collybiopsis confluens TaxID=2823264 RepID=A0A8H5HTD0_9AGAR|nr:hypothetical protein D9757_004886 [Collybiopsis confluens]
MLIRLIPSVSQPTVLFKLVFENLPETLQTPTAWVEHLTALDSDDLEIPESLHALDKSAGIVSLCDEVVFNMVDNKIRCVLCDGEVEEWKIGSEHQALAAHQRTDDLARRLGSVINDVNESAAEMQREHIREEEARKDQQRLREEVEEAAKLLEPGTRCSSFSRKQGRPGHKKQRSLLMNLVSSLISLNLNSPRSPRSLLSSFPPSPTSSPPSSPRASSENYVTQTVSAPPTLSRSVTLPAWKSRRSRPVSTPSLSTPSSIIELPLPSPVVVIVGPPPPPPLSPRALRRRARSSLVDAFRIHVLPEITRRVRCSHSAVNAPVAIYGSDTSAPYYRWVVSSTLKRVDARLTEVSRELKVEMDALGIELSSSALSGLTGFDSNDVGSATDLQRLDSPSCTSGSEGQLVSSEGGIATGESGSRGAAHVVPTITEVVEHSLTENYVRRPTSISSAHHKVSLLSEIPPPVHPEFPLPQSFRELLTQHNDLSAAHQRLVHLLLTLHARAAATASDIVQREAVLEVRSRRRAWLNRSLQHSPFGNNDSEGVANWSGAMSSPFRPSGLGRHSYNSEEWECDPFHYLDAPLSPLSTLVTDVYPSPFDSEAEGSYASYVYAHRRKKSPSETNYRLSAVSEEETLVEFDTGVSVSHKGFQVDRDRHLDVEIDTDDEGSEDEGDETDVELLADIELNSLGEGYEDKELPKPLRPFLQIETFSATVGAKFSSTSHPANLPLHLDTMITPTVDPFEEQEDDRTPLALVAVANLSKRVQATSNKV